jgi:hypothetical protein
LRARACTGHITWGTLGDVLLVLEVVLGQALGEVLRPVQGAVLGEVLGLLLMLGLVLGTVLGPLLGLVPGCVLGKMQYCSRQVVGQWLLILDVSHPQNSKESICFRPGKLLGSGS